MIINHTLYASYFMQLTGTPSKHVFLSVTRAVVWQDAVFIWLTWLHKKEAVSMGRPLWL